jgi:hypothetical protein
MIEFSHTVSHPWAVMVHTQDAFFADRTMMHTLLFDNVAFETVQYRRQSINLLPDY